MMDHLDIHLRVVFPQQPKNKHEEDRLKPFKTHLVNVTAMPDQEEINSIWERTDDYERRKVKDEVCSA